MWTILLKEKSEAFEKFKKFKVLAEQEKKALIKTLRTDRGGEFTSLEFKNYFKDKGISRHLTAPYTPQQNGVVERRNRTLMEMTRSILKHMDVPNQYWGEAVRHATYLTNRIATRSLEGKTLYEALRLRRTTLVTSKYLDVYVMRLRMQKAEESLMTDLGLWFSSGQNPALKHIVFWIQRPRRLW